MELLNVEYLERRLRTPGDCVLPLMLDRQAEKLGDSPLFVFDGGPTWSYAEARRIARGSAAALEDIGVGRGERVLVWLYDGEDIVRLSLALHYLGAVFVPINPDLSGQPVIDLIEIAAAKIMITTAELLEQLPSEESSKLRRIVVLGTEETAVPTAECGIEYLAADKVAPIAREPMKLEPPIEPWDVHTIYFTSGTTGVPKGVESSYMHCATMAIDGLRYLCQDDRFVTPCAYFHIGGSYAPWSVIHVGASMVVVGRFSASRFWEQIRRTQATVALLIGAMCDFLMSRPADSEADSNPLRLAVIQPLPADAAAFARRFDLSIYTQYDQTEASPSLVSDLLDFGTEYAKGYCGQVRPGFQARIVDEHDRELVDDEAGELVIRCDVPWVIAERYFAMPEQTVRAWRHGWFHTGDIFRKDEHGNFFYVDRSKDVIRRRGENISSFEIERELVVHDAVAAAAAYGVASEHSEDEIMVSLEPAADMSIDPYEIAEFAAACLPAFMVPRFYRVLPQLPRSASDKIQKTDLKHQGVTVDTWDRVTAETVQASLPESR
jgi:crotonobetaine/carnitine-CoA ligase